jgi:muramoyltetrapeptide carboxypeptidase
MQNNSSPQPLKKGDLIYICSPAKAIEEKHLYYAKKLFEERGYRVKLSEHCLGQFNYFSGTDEERTNDLQSGLDDPEVKAIICARGGYGAIRILDRVQWAGMLRDPKWIVGFSDITVLHQRLQRFGMVSIHGTMPLNFTKNSKESIDSLFAALEGLEYTIKSKHHANNKHGLAKGRLIGGEI